MLPRFKRNYIHSKDKKINSSSILNNRTDGLIFYTTYAPFTQADFIQAIDNGTSYFIYSFNEKLLIDDNWNSDGAKIDMTTGEYIGNMKSMRRTVTRNGLSYTIIPEITIVSYYKKTSNTLYIVNCYTDILLINYTLTELANIDYTDISLYNLWASNDFRNISGKSLLSQLYENGYSFLMTDPYIATFSTTGENLTGYKSQWQSSNGYDSFMTAHSTGYYSWGLLHIRPIYNDTLTSTATSMLDFANKFYNTMPAFFTKQQDTLGATLEYKLIARIICVNIATLIQPSTKTYTNSTWNTSKTWYIKVTLSNNNYSNVVNYETSMLR